jgi:hypothetical protein
VTRDLSAERVFSDRAGAAPDQDAAGILDQLVAVSRLWPAHCFPAPAARNPKPFTDPSNDRRQYDEVTN